MHSQRFTLFLFILFFTISCRPRQQRVQFEIYSENNIPYSALDNDLGSRSFDFQRPDMKGTFPLYIMVHAGAFFKGDKSAGIVDELGDELAKKGNAVASINYSLISEKEFGIGISNVAAGKFVCSEFVYESIQDVRTAIRHLKSNHEQYQIDPNRIYLVGYSAGAIIGLHLAYMDDEEANEIFVTRGNCLDCLPARGEQSNVDATLNGVVAISGGLFSDDLIDPSDNTPVLMMHGKRDSIVPFGIGYPFSKFIDRRDAINIPELENGITVTRTTSDGRTEEFDLQLDLDLAIPEWLKRSAAKMLFGEMYGSGAIINDARKANRESKLIANEGDHTFMRDRNGLFDQRTKQELVRDIVHFTNSGKRTKRTKRERAPRPKREKRERRRDRN